MSDDASDRERFPRGSNQRLDYWRGSVDSELRRLGTALTDLRVSLDAMGGRTERRIEQEVGGLHTQVRERTASLEASIDKLRLQTDRVGGRVEDLIRRISLIVGGLIAVGFVLQYFVGPLMIKLLTKGP